MSHGATTRLASCSGRGTGRQPARAQSCPLGGEDPREGRGTGVPECLRAKWAQWHQRPSQSCPEAGARQRAEVSGLGGRGHEVHSRGDPC